MPFIVTASSDPLIELEHRQDNVLRQLDELDQRIEQALREFAVVQKETAERFGRPQKAAA